jgi:hypothetical protein
MEWKDWENATDDLMQRMTNEKQIPHIVSSRWK